MNGHIHKCKKYIKIKKIKKITEQRLARRPTRSVLPVRSHLNTDAVWIITANNTKPTAPVKLSLPYVSAVFEGILRRIINVTYNDRFSLSFKTRYVRARAFFQLHIFYDRDHVLILRLLKYFHLLTSLVVTSSFSDTLTISRSFSNSSARTRSMYTASLSFRCCNSCFSCKREIRVGERGVEAADRPASRLGVALAVAIAVPSKFCPSFPEHTASKRK